MEHGIATTGVAVVTGVERELDGPVGTGRRSPLRRSGRLATVILVLAGAATAAGAAGQERFPTPLRQSSPLENGVEPAPLTLRDASRDDRWLGVGVRDVRWSPAGDVVYFRWHRNPAPGDLEEMDPWFRAGAGGEWVEELPAELEFRVPGERVEWDRAGRRAAWARNGAVYLYDGEDASGVRSLAALAEPASDVRMSPDGEAVLFRSGAGLYEFQVDAGSLTLVAMRVPESDEGEGSDASVWLAEEQIRLLSLVGDRAAAAARRAAHERRPGILRPQAIPLPEGATLDQLQRSPDGRFITFRARFPARSRPDTRYMDYLDESGYSQPLTARSKVGEARDRLRLGVVSVDPSVPPDSVRIRWIDVPGAGERNTVPHGPWWNLDGTRAVAQFIGEDHRDVWISEVDLATATARVVIHDHDDAWIGGPPVQANSLQPALLEWIAGDRFVFASERTGWSHLYRVDADGTVTPLTEGEWEVREARLSRDRSRWLLQASREHPGEDHLYTMPAAGGALERLTEGRGRHQGWWSPDGRRLARLHDDATHMADLYVGPVDSRDRPTRITESGTAAYRRVALATPELVSFPHPDGGEVWAALYRPAEAAAATPALIHAHGGGYRQFAHSGWTVYGWGLHLGFLHYMLEQGYTVLDLDYRGSAGFGRDYRTSIARSMGTKDVDGAAAAARYLVAEHGIDAGRIGIYGVSYGGFMTLMAQFRYPGVFRAGIARAAVTDWAHYSDGWTSRILGVPHEDPEAYRRSSPIYHAEGLEDRLLITHGLVDDNVHFQDAARLIQRLIELEKDFEVMVYPGEPHTVESESARYDLVRRSASFFHRWLVEDPASR